MHQYLPELITILGIHMLGVISPGSDFVMVSRNALVYSRRTGVYSALGIACGLVVHITYLLIGIGVIIAQSILLFNTIKYIGAGYLIYIGIKSLRAKPQEIQRDTVETKKELTKWQAVRMGFLTNLFNPKATLWFLGLFTQVIDPTTPIVVQSIYGVTMIATAFAWFTLVAMVLSHQSIKVRFVKIGHWIDRTMGAILIALGIKIALSGKE
ncbi:MAG: LysE family transporter [Patescibacteria group bacterium]